MAKSTRSPRTRKSASDRPKKPYPDFPLYAHPLGYWSKKIGGKIRHFGRWGRVVSGKLSKVEGDGWKEALELYKAQVDNVHAGRINDSPVVRSPQATSAELTVAELCNRFLTAKLQLVESGEITSRTFDEYKHTTDRLIATFSKTRVVDSLTADDFEGLRADIAKQWGPIRLGNEIQRVRTVFKYGFEAGLIEKPVRFGPQFKKPSRHVLRKHRAASGQRMFEAGEIRAMLDAASPQLRAMILLGINAGFGNADCGTLPISAVDLNDGWVRFPRPKTGIERRCPLWPETVEALKSAIAERPIPKVEAHSDRVFMTKYGKPWSHGGTSDAVTQETGKLLRKLKINGRRGLGFYALRHTFRTIADATRDFPAVRLVMGHADETIDSVYREHIDDSRLRAVADHVRAWLWPKPTKKTPADKSPKPKRKPRKSADDPQKVRRSKPKAVAARRFTIPPTAPFPGLIRSVTARQTCTTLRAGRLLRSIRWPSETRRSTMQQARRPPVSIGLETVQHSRTTRRGSVSA